jgi:hypothetical protein
MLSLRQLQLDTIKQRQHWCQSFEWLTVQAGLSMQQSIQLDTECLRLNGQDVVGVTGTVYNINVEGFPMNGPGSHAAKIPQLLLLKLVISELTLETNLTVNHLWGKLTTGLLGIMASHSNNIQ